LGNPVGRSLDNVALQVAFCFEVSPMLRATVALLVQKRMHFADFVR